MDDSEVRVPGRQGDRVVLPEEGGAIRRLAVDDSSRKRFLKMAGGAGAASALSLLLAACGDDEDEAADTGAPEDTSPAGKDLDILNYALTLEYLEAGFYRAVLESDVQPPSQEIAEIVQTFGDQEQEHVDALVATVEQMGGTPAEDPQGNFESVIQEGAREILLTAARLENLGAAAYLSEAPQIQGEEVLAAALSIHSVEARHAAAINELAGAAFTGDDQFEGSLPDGAFATPADRETVMQELEPFLGGGSSGGD